MTPSPAQARLLRAMSAEKAYANVNINQRGIINRVFKYHIDDKCALQTFINCLKNGWITKQEIERKSWNETVYIETIYVLSQAGRDILATLKPDDYISKLASLTSNDVLAVLKQKFCEPEWLFIPELRVGTGYGFSREQRIDAWALNTFPSKQFAKIAFEIKVYRSDFLKEITHPEKRKAAMGVCNQFYFATIEGVAKSEEIPDDCGWFEVNETRAILKKKAPYHQCGLVDWSFVASVFRRIPLE